jgi:hypothetical protein
VPLKSSSYICNALFICYLSVIFLEFIFSAVPFCIFVFVYLYVCMSLCLTVCLCICAYVFVSVYMFLVGVKYIYNLSNDLICLALFKDLVEFIEYFIIFLLSFWIFLKPNNNFQTYLNNPIVITKYGYC